MLPVTTPTNPLTVSVIIPTYNRAKLVQAAVESVLKQTRVPDEIVVVDDGSTDGTVEALRRFGAPVVVVSQTNQGRSAARNRGLREAHGDLILFLDSDDLLAPECVEHYLQVLEQHPEVGVVYSDAYVVDRDGNRVALYSHAMRGNRPSGMVLGELARRCFVTVSSMVRRPLLGDDPFEVGAEHCEDYDVWRRLSARCQFLFLNEPLLSYRFHEGMTNARQRNEILAAEVEVQQRFMRMPEFAQLPSRDRARVYCVHGIKNAMIDRPKVAREYFWKAVRTSPGYLGGLLLTLVSLGGTRLLKNAIVLRRRLAGNRLGTTADPQTDMKRQMGAPVPGAKVSPSATTVISQDWTREATHAN